MRNLIAFVVAISSAIAASSPSEFHLAYGGKGEMSVSFTLDSSLPQTCTYGLNSGPQSSSASTVVKSYIGGTFHHATMVSLEAGKKYSYSCAGGPTFDFLAPPPAGDLTWGGFATFGDWGYLGSKERGPSLPVGGLQLNWSAVPVRELLETWKNDGNMSFILHTGDIVYADDGFGEHPLEFTYENVTTGWFSWIQNLSASFPLVPHGANPESQREAGLVICWYIK